MFRMKLQDRVAIVTGGGRGIGEAIALTLARQGARVVVASRTQAELDRVVAQICEAGGQAEAIPADVGQQSSVFQLVEKTLKTFGQIDILVNAAATYGPIGPMWEADIEEWTRAVQINLGGTFMCCHAVLPHMIGRSQGKIINFSGGGATFPLPRATAYGTSKAAIVRLTEALAEEVKEHNIQVNAVAPGAVDTAIQDQVLEAGERAGSLLDQMKRLRETGEGGVPRELAAELVLYLVSGGAGQLTGKLIAAPHDGWQTWDAERVEDLLALPWFTLRRMDPFTLKPFLQMLEGG